MTPLIIGAVLQNPPPHLHRRQKEQARAAALVAQGASAWSQDQIGQSAYMWPTAPVARNKVQAIYAELCEKGLFPYRLPIVIDCSANMGHWVVGHTPFLTAPPRVCGGFFITQIGRTRHTPRKSCVRLEDLTPRR